MITQEFSTGALLVTAEMRQPEGPHFTQLTTDQHSFFIIIIIIIVIIAYCHNHCYPRAQHWGVTCHCRDAPAWRPSIPTGGDSPTQSRGHVVPSTGHRRASAGLHHRLWPLHPWSLQGHLGAFPAVLSHQGPQWVVLMHGIKDLSE